MIFIQYDETSCATQYTNTALCYVFPQYVTKSTILLPLILNIQADYNIIMVDT